MSVAAVNPYCTVQQVRDFIRNQDSGIADQLQFAVNAASRWIDEYKGQDYFEHDFTADPGLIIDDWREQATREVLWIGYKPVIALDSVQVGPDVWVQETDATIAAGTPADYRVRYDTGQLISFRGTWLPNHRFFPGLIHSGVVEQLSENWALQLRGTQQQYIRVKGRFGYEQRDAPISPATLGALNTALVPAGLPLFLTQACIEIAATFSRWNFKDIVGLDGTKTSLLQTDVPKSAIYLLGARAKVMV